MPIEQFLNALDYDDVKRLLDVLDKIPSDLPATIKNGNDSIVTAIKSLAPIDNGVSRYGLTLVSGTQTSFTNSTTYYFGSTTAGPSTTNAINRVYIPKNGTIKVAYIFAAFGVNGTNENWTMTIRVNDTTDTTISTVGVSASTRIWSNAGLSIPVATGDFIEIKNTTPAWVTKPTNGVFSGVIYIE